MTTTLPNLTTTLVLEVAQTSPDGGGGSVTSWTALGTHWAEITPSSARDTVLGGRVQATVTHRIRVRSAPVGSPQRPEPSQRFRLGERVFSIIATAEDTTPGYLRVWAEEGRLV